MKLNSKISVRGLNYPWEHRNHKNYGKSKLDHMENGPIDKYTIENKSRNTFSDKNTRKDLLQEILHNCRDGRNSPKIKMKEE